MTRRRHTHRCGRQLSRSLQKLTSEIDCNCVSSRWPAKNDPPDEFCYVSKLLLLHMYAHSKFCWRTCSCKTSIKPHRHDMNNAHFSSVSRVTNSWWRVLHDSLFMTMVCTTYFPISLTSHYNIVFFLQNNLVLFVQETRKRFIYMLSDLFLISCTYETMLCASTF